MTEHDWGPPDRTHLEEPMRLGEILDAILNPLSKVEPTTLDSERVIQG